MCIYVYIYIIASVLGGVEAKDPQAVVEADVDHLSAS